MFRLKAACERIKNAPKDATDPETLFTNAEVLSSRLEWVPQGEQGTVMSANPPAPTNPNIVLAKLRPGQEIDMEVHAVKGVGKDHAKFCPVGEHTITHSYRSIPLIFSSQPPRPTVYSQKSSSTQQNPYQPISQKSSKNVSPRASSACTHARKKSALTRNQHVSSR